MIKTQGIRHIALRVRDVERERRFYSDVFGMRLVWQPDPDNAYLSSGPDNLALHREAGLDNSQRVDRLDHMGFFVERLEDLQRYFTWVQERGLEVVHPLRQHRDGTSSFYIRDPEGIVIQLLHDPASKNG